MPAATPVLNALAQNSVDFNNQTLSNPGGLFKYKSGANLNNGQNYNITKADINSIITSAGNNNAPAINTINLSGMQNMVNNGSEIILFAVDFDPLNPIYVSGGTVISDNNRRYVLQGETNISKLVCVDSSTNSWLLSGNLGSPLAYSTTDCCAAEVSFTQITDEDFADINNGDILNRYFFEGASSTIYPFNGLVNIDSTVYKIVNGLNSGTDSCAAMDFNTGFTFYLQVDNVDPITLYSDFGASSALPSAILGHRYFNTSHTDVLECAPGDPYEGSLYTADNTYYLTFRNGYLASYT